MGNFWLSSKHFHFHGQIIQGVTGPTRGHTKCCFLGVPSTDLHKALTAGSADFWVSFPPASSAVAMAPKEAFLLIQHLWWSICQGFDLGLLICACSVQGSQRVSQPNFPTLGLLSSPQAMFCWHCAKPANPTTLIFLRFFQCSAHSPTRSAFAAFRKESKEFLTKYNNLGD